MDTAWWRTPRRLLFHIFPPSSKWAPASQNKLSQQPVYWKITVNMRIACCSEFILKLYSPMDCAQESLVLERNRRALQVYSSFIEGSNDPLVKQDSLEESDVLCHFWWGQQLLAWYKWKEEALCCGNLSSNKKTVLPHSQDSPRQRRVKEPPSCPADPWAGLLSGYQSASAGKGAASQLAILF